MARVYLSLGSNIERERYIAGGLDDLHAHFAPLTISSIYESEAVGFDGAAFFNLVVGLDTALPLGTLFEQLRAIEHHHHRCRQARKFSPRTLDIDILTYGDLVGVHAGIRLPRAEILDNAFVLWPLAEIAGDERHPLLGRTYRELWQAYDKTRQVLRPVPFNWRGRDLSAPR